MYKYWYAVEKQGAFYIGFCFAPEGSTESDLVENMQEYCRRKTYRMTLLVQITPIGIVNQIYPGECTEESRMCLEEILNAVMQ